MSDKQDDRVSLTRAFPNIIITGTPGVGKTKTALRLAEKSGMKYICINTIVKEQNCHEGLDIEFDSLILDEDKLLDALEPLIVEQSSSSTNITENNSSNKGLILDYHSVDFFPEDWMDLIVVLRAQTEVLYDRLLARNYSTIKIQENMECEIMQVVLDEARQAFGDGGESNGSGIVIVELMSNSSDDMEGNIHRIEMWIDQWKKDNEYLLGSQNKKTRT